jgi:hypothetical protein
LQLGLSTFSVENEIQESENKFEGRAGGLFDLRVGRMTGNTPLIFLGPMAHSHKNWCNVVHAGYARIRSVGRLALTPHGLTQSILQGVQSTTLNKH